MLVLTTMFINVSNNLPKTSYVKMIDVWLIFNLLLPFIEVLVHTYMDTLRSQRIFLWFLFLAFKIFSLKQGWRGSWDQPSWTPCWSWRNWYYAGSCNQGKVVDRFSAWFQKSRPKVNAPKSWIWAFTGFGILDTLRTPYIHLGCWERLSCCGWKDPAEGIKKFLRQVQGVFFTA